VSNQVKKNISPFFWLHIKKSAGGSIRRLLTPEYIDVDRDQKPMNFIQAHPSQYNAILNKFRIPLGEYRFRRALFAKRYLYPNNWDDLLSFAFVREPMARCISAFFYLRNQVGWERSFLQEANATDRPIEQQFTLFLNVIESAQNSTSIYMPINLHFTTHTAAMWDDVTDENGTQLIRHIFRLDDLHKGLSFALNACGIDRDLAQLEHVNQRAHDLDYTPTAAQVAKIHSLYARDFDLYEMADGNA